MFYDPDVVVVTFDRTLHGAVASRLAVVDCELSRETDTFGREQSIDDTNVSIVSQDLAQGEPPISMFARLEWTHYPIRC